MFSLLFGDCFSSSIHCSGSYQHDCNSKCSNHSGLWGCWHTETVSQLEEKRASSECGSKSEFIQVRSNSPGKFHQLFRNIFFKELTFSLYQWGQKMYKVLRTSQYAESILFFLMSIELVFQSKVFFLNYRYNFSFHKPCGWLSVSSIALNFHSAAVFSTFCNFIMTKDKNIIWYKRKSTL